MSGDNLTERADKVREIVRWSEKRRGRSSLGAVANSYDLVPSGAVILTAEEYAALEKAEQERDERLTRESGVALIEEANRWERLHRESQAQLAACREELAQARRERDEAGSDLSQSPE